MIGTSVERLIGTRFLNGVLRGYVTKYHRMADDIRQEVYLAIFRAEELIRRADSTEAYVAMIVHRTCQGVIRRDRRQHDRMRSLDAMKAGQDDDASGYEPADPWPGPDRLAEILEPAPAASVPSDSYNLSLQERDLLAAIIRCGACMTRVEIATEFTRRAGRPLHYNAVSKARRRLGLPPASPGNRARRLDAAS